MNKGVRTPEFCRRMSEIMKGKKRGPYNTKWRRCPVCLQRVTLKSSPMWKEVVSAPVLPIEEVQE